MKKVMLAVCLLAAANVATAALGDVSSVGLTGLWRFHNSANPGEATVGTNMVFGDGGGGYMTGPWTDLGVPAWHTMYSDGGIVQEAEWGYLQAYHGISPNGGGSYVNEFTFVVDYRQTSDLTQYNGLFQTTSSAHGNDADLFTDGAGHIGVGGPGYSTLTYDASTWHRIAWSVDNGNFFRVYVDGVLFLDASGQDIDGRWSLNDNIFLFADNDWHECGWGLVGTVAAWNRALSSAEIADMGGWINGAATPTALILVPEPATLAMLGLGALALIKRRK